MTVRLAAAVGMLGLGLTAGSARALSLASGWVTDPDNGHAYAMLDSSAPVLAEMAAVKLGGHLVTIRNAAEQSFVFSNFGAYGGAQHLLWTGLTDAAVEGQFRWMSGEPVTYTNWASGEPNDSTAGENYVAIYYPNHSQAGRWNDWTTHITDPIGLPFNGVVERGPQDHRPAFLLETDTTWRTISPAGNSEGQPIMTTGVPWQGTHVGWNSSLTFDDSTWSDATLVGDSVWGSGEDTPTYFRKTFDLASLPGSMTLLTNIDDDFQLYINGQLVIDDQNAHSDDFGPLEIASYLHTGTNLIAIKAQDAGGPQSLGVMLYSDSVPEPTTLLAAGLIAALGCGRHRP